MFNVIFNGVVTSSTKDLISNRFVCVTNDYNRPTVLYTDTDTVQQSQLLQGGECKKLFFMLLKLSE